MSSTTRVLFAAAAMAAGAFGQGNNSTIIILHGKVTLEDGLPPPKMVVIEQMCSDQLSPDNVALSEKNGQFTWRRSYDPSESRVCNIRAVLQGYRSSAYTLPAMTVFSDPNLPPLTLTAKGSNSQLDVLAETTEGVLFGGAKVPESVQIPWGRAIKAINKNLLPDAERQLALVNKSAPKFALGWDMMAIVLERENKPTDAFQDYRRAIEIDPKLTGAYIPLARLCVLIKDWDNADLYSGDLIKIDAAGKFPEARMVQATARYQLKNYDGAIQSASEVIRLDGAKHKMPYAEYLVAVSLSGKKDYAGAQDHLRKYLGMLSPTSPEVDSVRRLIASVQKSMVDGLDPGIAPSDEALVGGLNLANAGVPGEAWVPGGRKALAEVTGLKDASSYENFFADYCRQLAREETIGTSQGIPEYLTTIRAYMATVTELLPFGQKDGDTTKFDLSLSTDAQRRATERVLGLFGWKLISKDGAVTVEPSDQPGDGPRQHIPKLFGIDEIKMQQALEAGKNFQFEVPSENARIVGGNDWGEIIKQLPTIPGGIAAAFTQDVRIAKTYAGLGAMSPEASQALIRAEGITDLVLKYSDPLARYGESLVIAKDAQGKEYVAVPGGPAAEPAWRKLAGANPRETRAFFRALLDKHEGRLLAFYHSTWSADEAHQKYITFNETRAERFYNWYRESDELKLGINQRIAGWHTELLQKLPLEGEGDAAKVRFPGSRRAWSQSAAPDEEALLGLKTLESMVPIARLEQRRGAPLDEASVTLLAAHYAEWKSLFPYFEKLPTLGPDEFTSLQAFAAAVAKQPAARQNQVMGEWYSLVELIARGYKAGSLDGPASTRAFRRTCDGLSANDYAANALSTLRDIAAGPNLTEAVANLLRLSPEARGNFQRVLELQSVPRVDLNAPTPDPSSIVTALSGYIYAASVDPDALLISEDPRLLSRHQFVTAESAGKPPFVFASATLVGSNTPPGSFLKGGFGNFDEVAHSLANGGRSVPPIMLTAQPGRAPAADQPLPLLASAEIGGAEVVFHANGRVVEAYATVTDSRGKYVDDLTQDQFALLDGQKAQSLVGFESHAQPVSVALLLDTTGSMSLALPALKNAALKLIGELRPVDSVAVYSFNKSVTELQPFTTDMDSAKRAVLSTQALGETALYDALARVSRDLSGRAGKKVIVVFTDGADNSSTLTTDTAILRAKATGVPLFTIAEGEAMENRTYLAQLADLAKATGGESFAIKDSTEIGAVFEKVSEDLAHGYLLEFEPPSSDDRAWHPITIQVRVRGDKVVRSREGYYPE
jgi:Ca-activated chloride channel family protein